MMKFVSRRDWGARARKSSTAIPARVTGVALHWEGPHMGTFTHAKCDDKVRGIQAFHMDDRGWSDIAYTALVCPHGYVYEGRGVGQRTAANGTDAGNDEYYAVCYLGGERDGFTDAGKVGFLDSIQWLRNAGAGSKVVPHSFFKPTGCPGNQIRGWITEGLKRPGIQQQFPAPPKPILIESPTSYVKPKEIDMFIVLDPVDEVHQYLCDSHTKRHIEAPERALLITLGVQFLGKDDDANQRKEALAVRKLVVKP